MEGWTRDGLGLFWQTVPELALAVEAWAATGDLESQVSPHKRVTVRESRAWRAPLALGPGLDVDAGVSPTPLRAETGPIFDTPLSSLRSVGLLVTVPLRVAPPEERRSEGTLTCPPCVTCSLALQGAACCC